jgi:hypothetical protein
MLPGLLFRAATLPAFGVTSRSPPERFAECDHGAGKIVGSFFTIEHILFLLPRAFLFLAVVSLVDLVALSGRCVVDIVDILPRSFVWFGVEFELNDERVNDGSH